MRADDSEQEVYGPVKMERKNLGVSVGMMRLRMWYRGKTKVKRCRQRVMKEYQTMLLCHSRNIAQCYLEFFFGVRPIWPIVNAEQP